MTEEQWYRKSINWQMANIGSEVRRAIQWARNEMKAGNAELDGYDCQHIKVAQKLFEYTKRDPKNVGLIREVENAEADMDLLMAYPGGPNEEEWNLEAEEVLDYWEQFMYAYEAEMMNSESVEEK